MNDPSTKSEVSWASGAFLSVGYYSDKYGLKVAAHPATLTREILVTSYRTIQLLIGFTQCHIRMDFKLPWICVIHDNVGKSVVFFRLWFLHGCVKNVSKISDNITRPVNSNHGCFCVRI